MQMVLEFMREVQTPVALLALALMLLARRGRGRDEQSGASGRALLALATGAGVVLGLSLCLGWSTLKFENGWPPTPTEDRLVLLAIAATAIGVHSGLVDRAWQRIAGEGLLCLAAPAWVCLNLLEREDPPIELAQTLVYGALLFLVWRGLEPLAQRRPGPLVPFALAALIGAGAQCMFEVGTAVYAQYAGVASAAVGVGVLAALLRPGLSLARGALAAPLVLSASIWVAGLHLLQNKLPRECAALLLAAPLGLWLGELPLLRRRHTCLRTPIALLLPLAGAAYAWWLAHQAAPPPNPYEQYYR